MSDFEYLRSLSIASYLPLDSFIHHRDPRAKLTGVALLVIAMTITNTLAGIGLLALFGFGLLLLTRMPVRQAWRAVFNPLPFLLVLALLQVFIFPHKPDAVPVLQILGVNVFAEGLLSALRLLLRFSGLILLFSAAGVSISTLEIIHGLDLLLKPLTHMGVRTGSAAMTVQIMMRFLPFLAINAERIAKSQASRGAEWGSGKSNLFGRVRQFFPLLIPLFAGSLKQAETLADAMLARGFMLGQHRTGLVEYSFGWRDALFLLVCVLLSFGALFLF